MKRNENRKQKRVKVEKRNELDRQKMKAMEERGTNGDGGKDKTDFAPTGYIDVKIIYDLRDVRLCRPSLRAVILCREPMVPTQKKHVQDSEPCGSGRHLNCSNNKRGISINEARAYI